MSSAEALGWSPTPMLGLQATYLMTTFAGVLRNPLPLWHHLHCLIYHRPTIAV